MGSRTLPQECPHGRTISWGDFGPDDGTKPARCPDCENECSAAAERFECVLLGEVTTTAGHTHHDYFRCNCSRTVASILQRMRTDPEMVYAWLAKESRAGDSRDG